MDRKSSDRSRPKAGDKSVNAKGAKESKGRKGVQEKNDD
jgi:hypothetical protein